MESALLAPLAVLLLSSSPQAVDGEPALAVHDLRPLLPVQDGRPRWEHSLFVAPGAGGLPGERVRLDQLYQEAPADLVLDLVRQAALGPSTGARGEPGARSELALIGDRRMLASGPPAFQARVVEVLGLLEQALRGDLEIELDVLTWEGEEPAPLPDPSADSSGGLVLTAAEAGELAAALASGGAERESYRIRLGAGRTAVLDRMGRVPFVFDYDVEIAQAAWMFDPLVVEAETGTRVLLRGAPGAGGLNLSVVFQHARALGEVRDEELSVGGVVHEEKTGLAYRSGPKTVQAIEILQRAFAFDTHLAPGQAVLVRSEAELAGVESRQLLVLRLAAGDPSPVRELALPGPDGGTRLLAVHTELLTPPRVSIDGPVTPGGANRLPRFQARVSSEPSLFVRDWMKARLSFYRPIGVWSVGLAGRAFEGAGAPDAGALLRASAPQELVALEARLAARGLGGGSAAPVRIALPVRPGSQVGAVVGVLGAVLADFDVEVAQLSGVADPLRILAFDGLALAAEPSRSAAGDWLVDVRTNAQLALGPLERVSLGDPTSGSIERRSTAHLESEERLRVPPGSPRRIVGDSGPGEGGPTLRLEIAIR